MGLFEPDIFSSRVPVWAASDEVTSDVVLNVLKLLNFPDALDVLAVEKSGGLEINSGNFRITTSVGQYLLKRWGNLNTESNIRKLLRLLLWLDSNGRLPVSYPLANGADPMIVEYEGNLWNVFRFVSAEYYSGLPGQLEAAANMVGRLHSVLAKTPEELVPNDGPLIGREHDRDIFQRAIAQRHKWNTIFGIEFSQILDESWATIEKAWECVRRSEALAGSVQPSHFDLHPHNILMSGINVAAIIDFDSCKRIRVGYALAFAGLKLCRQAVSFSEGTLSADTAGRVFLQTLCETEPCYSELKSDFTCLALAEVLRRIGIILRLNLDNSDRKWNHVLPIQVRHILEAQALFGSL